MKEIRSANTTFDDDYRSSFSFLFLLLIGFGFISLAFLYTFPVPKIINHYVSKSLSLNKNCPLQFRDYKLGFFLPALEFRDTLIPDMCLGPNQKAFTLEKLKVGFGGINYSPFGVVANIGIKLGKNELKMKAASNGSDHVVKTTNQTIKLESLSGILVNKFGLMAPKLLGNAKLNLHLKTQGNNLDIFELSLSSSNLSIPSQNIMSFLIPELNLNDLDVDIKGKGKQVLIERLVTGNESSPLYLQTDGSVGLNTFNVSQSALDLNVHLRLSEQILEQYSIFKMVLAQFDKGENNYKIKVGGTLARAIPSPMK